MKHRDPNPAAASQEDGGTEKDPASTAVAPTRALVVVPELRRSASEANGHSRTLEARVDEAAGLARAIDLDVVEAIGVRVQTPRPATLFGTGKVDEFKLFVQTEKIGLVIVDHALSPVQQRNLEKALDAKVVDRTGLILEIFGARARTREGRLQVELAHLNYQRSRLVRSWTHLERQRGGYGFLGGPGETQIEADRRLLQERISRLEKDLDAVRRTRDLHRRNRRKTPHPVVALVGYTNAGKSTLFNRLTQSSVFAQDLLFATLDPTLRRIRLPHGVEVILSDTVGFISDLPTHLVAAFRATLEEVVEADVILHVRDIAHSDSDAQARDVAEILGVLGVDAHDGARVIEVLNKIDLLGEERRQALLAPCGDRDPRRARVAVSAASGEGVPDLLAAIEARIRSEGTTLEVMLKPEEGARIAWLHEHGEVLNRDDDADAVRIKVRLDDKQLGLYRAQFGGAAR